MKLKNQNYQPMIILSETDDSRATKYKRAKINECAAKFDEITGGKK